MTRPAQLADMVHYCKVPAVQMRARGLREEFIQEVERRRPELEAMEQRASLSHPPLSADGHAQPQNDAPTVGRLVAQSLPEGQPNRDGIHPGQQLANAQDGRAAPFGPPTRPSQEQLNRMVGVVEAVFDVVRAKFPEQARTIVLSKERILPPQQSPEYKALFEWLVRSYDQLRPHLALYLAVFPHQKDILRRMAMMSNFIPLERDSLSMTPPKCHMNRDLLAIQINVFEKVYNRLANLQRYWTLASANTSRPERASGGAFIGHQPIMPPSVPQITQVAHAP